MPPSNKRNEPSYDNLGQIVGLGLGDEEREYEVLKSKLHGRCYLRVVKTAFLYLHRN